MEGGWRERGKRRVREETGRRRSVRERLRDPGEQQQKTEATERVGEDMNK